MQSCHGLHMGLEGPFSRLSREEEEIIETGAQMVLLADKRSFIGSNPRHTMNGDGNYEERFEMPRKIPCVQHQQGQTSPLDSNNIWFSHMGEFYFVQDV